jgi:hypothetical protein
LLVFLLRVVIRNPFPAHHTNRDLRSSDFTQTCCIIHPLPKDNVLKVIALIMISMRRAYFSY